MRAKLNIEAAGLPKFQTRNGWVVFDLPPGEPQITNEMIDELEKADYEQEFQRALSPRR